MEDLHWFLDKNNNGSVKVGNDVVGITLGRYSDNYQNTINFIVNGSAFGTMFVDTSEYGIPLCKMEQEVFKAVMKQQIYNAINTYKFQINSKGE